MNMEIDVREVLTSVHVPTLLMFRSRDTPDADETQDEPMARYMAERIPDSRLVEVRDQGVWSDVVVPHLEPFLAAGATGERALDEERVLATVLFTDLGRLDGEGVGAWPALARVARLAQRCDPTGTRSFQGRGDRHCSDGFFASGFDGPARAIRCACAIRDRISALGLGIRVGVHTGECDIVDGKLAGLGVVIGSRVAAEAASGDVLVSGTGSRPRRWIRHPFEARGTQELKGVGEWPLYAVLDPLSQSRPQIA